MKTATKNGEKSVVLPARERRPFLRIEPRPTAVLPESAAAGLQALDEIVEEHVPALVQLLVAHTLEVQAGGNGGRRRMAPAVSVLNRRRRAARQWIGAILIGRVDRETLHTVGHSLIPILAGAGPEVHTGERIGLECFEFLRGAVTARIFDRPAANLVPYAKALHAFETVLAIHLDAYERAVRQSREALQPAS